MPPGHRWNTTLYAVKRARNKGSIISYDPNYRESLWPDEKTAKQQMRSLILYVDHMKISDEETELLTDENEVEKKGAIPAMPTLEQVKKRL